jgi:hypothetical protein
MARGMKVMVDPALPDHRKVRALARLLGVHPMQAMGHILALWCRVMKEAPLGNIRSWNDGDIADAAKWDGDAALFVASMRDKSVQFLDRYQVHDWIEEQGDVVAKRESWRRRQNRARRKEGGQIPNAPSEMSRVTHARQVRDISDVTRESRVPVPLPSVPVPSVPSLSIPVLTDDGGGAAAPRQPGGVLEVLEGGLTKAKLEEQEVRAKVLKASYDLATTLGGASGEALARYVGFLDSKDGISSKQIIEATRKLFNHRQGMAIQMGDKVPFDRIFAYGIDQAIEHGATSTSYVGKVCQTEYVRQRDKCGRA